MGARRLKAGFALDQRMRKRCHQGQRNEDFARKTNFETVEGEGSVMTCFPMYQHKCAGGVHQQLDHAVFVVIIGSLLFESL